MLYGFLAACASLAAGVGFSGIAGGASAEMKLAFLILLTSIVLLLFASELFFSEKR